MKYHTQDSPFSSALQGLHSGLVRQGRGGGAIDQIQSHDITRHHMTSHSSLVLDEADIGQLSVAENALEAPGVPSGSHGSNHTTNDEVTCRGEKGRGGEGRGIVRTSWSRHTL